MLVFLRRSGGRWRPGSSSSSITRRYQSSNSGSGTPPPNLEETPERIRKYRQDGATPATRVFKRTMAPIASHLAGTEVPTVVRGEKPSHNSDSRPPRTQNNAPRAPRKPRTSELSYAELDSLSSSSGTKDSGSASGTARRFPPRQRAPGQNASPNRGRFDNKRRKSFNKRDAAPAVEAVEEEVPFDVAAFVASQDFSALTNADGTPLSAEDIASARQALMELIQGGASGEAVVGSAATGENATPTPPTRPQTPAARASVETRPILKALQSSSTTPIPPHLRLANRPSYAWERTRYTATPSPSFGQQSLALKDAEAEYLLPMASSATSTKSKSSTKSVAKTSGAGAVKAIDASRGASTFRREVLAGDYASQLLAGGSRKEGSAASAAKLALRFNASMPLAQKMKAMEVIGGFSS